MFETRWAKYALGLFGTAMILFALSGCGGAAAPTYAYPEEPMEEESAEGEEVYRDVEVSGLPASADDISQSHDRMVIKNGEIALKVEDVDTAIDQVTQIAVDNGGYVLSSQSWGNDDYKSASITIAVRSEQFEVAMRRLRESASEVIRESASGEDVSAEYVDLDSRLRNLEATRDRIAGFLDEAKTVEEALKVNKELAQIEAEIEQIKGRMQYIEGRTDFSTIAVSLEMAAPVPVSEPWTIETIVQNALDTQSDLLRGLTGASLWSVIVLLPYVLVIGGIVLAARWITRRMPEKSKKHTTG